MGYFQMTRNVEELFGGVITAPHQIPFTYKSNVGGETFLSLPFYPVTGVVTINGGMQVPLDNFEIEGNMLNLGRALSKGDVVYCLFDKILSPEDTAKGIRIYKFQAVGGETEFTPDFTSYGVQSLYIGGEYKTPEIEYSYNSTTGKVSLQTALTAGVWVVAEMSVKQPNISPLFDRSIQEIARSANVKDSEVILSNEVSVSLNGKTIIYDVTSQKIYGLPILPSNVYIASVTNGQLTYNPGGVVVDLLAVPNLVESLSSDDGASRIGTSTGETVEERFTDVDASIDALYDASRTVLNVAELRTVVPTHAGQRIRTLSAASASVAEIPFGGGEFYARFISGAVDDGGYIIVPTSGTLSWVRLQTGKVMLDDFGAKADWSTDNADAIRRALTFGKNNKVVVHCNSGTYLTSETVEIRKGTGLIGVSRNSTTIAKTTNNQLTITGSGTTPDAHIDAFVAIVGDIYDVNDLTGASDMSFLQLRGITFRREGLTGRDNAVQYGIWAPKINTSQFEDLRVECGYFGFWGNDVWSNTFTSCQFLGLGVGQYAGIHVDRTIGAVHTLSGTSNVFNCVGVANYQLGFHINSNQYTVLNSCTADGIRPMSGTSETFACPFFFINPHGITMNSCGSEGVSGERLRIVQDEYAVYDSTVVINGYQGQIVPENPVTALPVFRVQGSGTKSINVVMNACNFIKDASHSNQQNGFVAGANTKVALIKCLYDETLIISGGAVVTTV